MKLKSVFTRAAAGRPQASEARKPEAVQPDSPMFNPASRRATAGRTADDERNDSES